MLFVRPDFEHIVEQLKVQGGYIVVSDQYVRTPPFKRLISDLPAPKIGLNSAGGTSATEIARILGSVFFVVVFCIVCVNPTLFFVCPLLGFVLLFFFVCPLLGFVFFFASLFV